jgi:hypothetical protein
MSGLLDNPITILTVLLCIVIIYYSLKYTNKDSESFGGTNIPIDIQKRIDETAIFLNTNHGIVSTAPSSLNDTDATLPTNCKNDELAKQATVNLFDTIPQSGQHDIRYTKDKHVYVKPFVGGCNPNISRNPNLLGLFRQGQYNFNKDCRSKGYVESVSINDLADSYRCGYDNGNLRNMPKKWLENKNSKGNCDTTDGWDDHIWPSHKFYRLPKKDPVFANSVLANEQQLGAKLQNYLKYITSEETCAPVTSLLHKDSMSSCYLIKSNQKVPLELQTTPSILKANSIPINLTLPKTNHNFLYAKKITINLAGLKVSDIRDKAKEAMNNTMNAVGIIYRLEPDKEEIVAAEQDPWSYDTKSEGVPGTEASWRDTSSGQVNGSSCMYVTGRTTLPYTDNIENINNWSCSGGEVYLLMHKEQRNSSNSLTKTAPLDGDDAYNNFKSALTSAEDPDISYIPNTDKVNGVGTVHSRPLVLAAPYSGVPVVLETRTFKSNYDVDQDRWLYIHEKNANIDNSRVIQENDRIKWSDCKTNCINSYSPSQEAWPEDSHMNHVVDGKCGSYRVADPRKCTSISWNAGHISSTIDTSNSPIKTYTISTIRKGVLLGQAETWARGIALTPDDSPITSNTNLDSASSSGTTGAAAIPEYSIDFSQSSSGTSEESDISLTKSDSIIYVPASGDSSSLTDLPMKLLIGTGNNEGSPLLKLEIGRPNGYDVTVKGSNHHSNAAKYTIKYTIKCPSETKLILEATITRTKSGASNVTLTVELKIVSIIISSQMATALRTNKQALSDKYSIMLSSWNNTSNNNKYCSRDSKLNSGNVEISGESGEYLKANNIKADCNCTNLPLGTDTIECEYNNLESSNICCNTSNITKLKESVSRAQSDVITKQQGVSAAEVAVKNAEEEVKNAVNNLQITKNNAMADIESFVSSSSAVRSANAKLKSANAELKRAKDAWTKAKENLAVYIGDKRVVTKTCVPKSTRGTDGYTKYQPRCEKRGRMGTCEIGGDECIEKDLIESFSTTCTSAAELDDDKLYQSVSDNSSCQTTYSKCHDSVPDSSPNQYKPYKSDCSVKQEKYLEDEREDVHNAKIAYDGSLDELIQKIENDINGLDYIKVSIITNPDGLDKLQVMYKTTSLEESTAVGTCKLYNTVYDGKGDKRGNTDWLVKPSSDNSDVLTAGNFYTSRQLINRTIETNPHKNTKYLVRQIYLFDSLDINTLDEDGSSSNGGGVSDNYSNIYKVKEEIGSFTQLRDAGSNLNSAVWGEGSNLLYNVTVPTKTGPIPNKTITTCKEECTSDKSCFGYTLDQKPIAYTQSDVDYPKLGDPSVGINDEPNRFLRSIPRVEKDTAIKLSMGAKTGKRCPHKNDVYSESGNLVCKTLHN